MTDRNALIEEALPGYRRWLYRLAYDHLPHGSSDIDDLAQEGYIAMWRAVGTWDEAKGALPSWLTGAARQRMRDVTYGGGRWTGHEALRGRREVDRVSLDAIVESAPDAVLGDVATLDGVEMAYHDGEIAEALAALPPEQRAYVYARFWLGLDPSSRAPAMRALVDQFPALRKRWLWTGSTHTTGARERLAASLRHLSAA